MIRFLVLLFLFCSCATKPPASKLFPFGVYRHQVTVERKGTTQSFSGVNKWTSHDLTLVALGAMDVTLIKYTENLMNGDQQVFIDENFIPMSEKQAKKYFGFVKEIYSLDRSICEKKRCHKKFYRTMDFYFDLNDANEVSEIWFEIRDAKVRIKVVGYEKSV